MPDNINVWINEFNMLRYNIYVKVMILTILGTSSYLVYLLSYNSERIELETNLQIILLWTPIFGDWNWYPQGSGKKPFQNGLCHYEDCYLTKDRSYLEQAKAVLFHCRDGIDTMPQTRTPQQLYGVACQESPMASDFRQYKDWMNITMTYRRDSDIFFPNCWFKPKLDTSSSKPYVPKLSLSNKLYSIAWPVSNCQTSSRRELYMDKLAKHTEVHVYGACGKYKCPKNNNDQCMKHFADNYKFYASFENALCRDYISEKFFYPLQHDIIPIVLGGADYSYFPKHSYINVRDFKSTKNLAEYLNYLSNNETAYNEYFQWKTTHELQCANKEKLFCDLCKMVQTGYKKQYTDVNKWWSDGICDLEGINLH